MFNVIILGIASFLTDISTEMVYRLLPLYLTSARIGATPAIVATKWSAVQRRRKRHSASPHLACVAHHKHHHD